MEQPAQNDNTRRLTLGDFWAIAQMQRTVVLSSVAACFVAALVYTLLATRTYTAMAVVHLSTMAGQEIRTERVVDLDTYQRWNRGMYVATQLDVLKSRSVRVRILERYAALGLDDGVGPDDKGFALLDRGTTIKVRQGTELMDISVETADPEMSARLANLTAEVFRDDSLAARTEASRQSTDWLVTNIADQKGKIEVASAALLAFQKEHRLEDAGNEQTSLGAVMGSLNTAYGEANTERVKHESMLRTHERLLRAGNYDELAKDMNTPLIVSLTRAYAEAATKHARVAAVYGEKHQDRIVVQAELQRIEDELKGEVQRTLEAERERLRLLQDKERDLGTAIDGSKDELLGVEGKLVQYEMMRLAQQTAEDEYARLVARLGELELQARTQLNNLRILEEALPPKAPSSPRVTVNLAAGLGIGLILGIAIGLLREYLDDSISSPLDVATYLRAPFLGMIPKIEGVTDETRLALYTHEQPRSTVAEALRAIRTVMEFSPTTAVPRRLLVTSAVSEEGKTSTVVRLGVAFANLNRRVLLVDADLRRPRIHKIFGVSREVGLSTVLTNEAREQDVIHTTEVPGLFFMPSGRGGEHPNELLASTAVPKLLERLSEQFDLVIIDTPPTAILSDARILSRHVDGVVILVREQATSRMLVREAIQGLDQVGARIIGVVVNAVDFARRRTSYKYYYGYGYRYEQYHYAERTDTAAK